MGSPLPPDPYVALGVPKDATPAAIKTAHRKLVLKCHPDKVTDPAAKQAAADLFHKIQSSYEILIDEDRRGRYNAQVRLEELRREALERRGGGDSSRRGQDTRGAPATQRSSREPSFNDAYFSRSSDDMAPQFEERRPAYATADPSDAPPRATARKEPELERPSRRGVNEPKEKAKASARDSSRERHRAVRDERKQRTQRDIRQNRDRKPGPYMEDGTESDSDEHARRSARRTRDDDDATLRRAREELYEQTQRQQKEATTNGNYDDRTRKMFAQHNQAWDYIMHSSRTRPPAEQERRPSPVRISSSKDRTEHVSRSSDARPAPVMRRSSVRPRTEDRDTDFSRRRSARESGRRSPEVTEEIRRPPTFNKSVSSPVEIRIPSDKPRAQSWQDDMDVPLLRNPQIRRAETMPYNGTSRRGDNAPASKPYSRPAEFNDGPASAGPVPTYVTSPQSAKTPYSRPFAEDAEYGTSDGYRTSGDSYRTEVREPERGRPAYTRRVTRSPSPMERPRMPGGRYSSSSQAMPSSGRKMSYVVGDTGGVELVDRTRPSSARTATASSPREPQASQQRFYGQISNPPPPSRPVPEAYPSTDRVSYSKPIRPEDLKVQSGHPSYRRSGGDRPTVHRNGSSKPVFV